MTDDLLRQPCHVPSLALRPREAATAIGVSARTLWAWTRSGDVPHIRRGGVTLYPVDAMRDWLAAQVIPPAKK